MVRTTEHAIIQEQAEYIHRNLLPCSLLAMISAVIVAVIFEGTHPAWQYGMFVATVLLLEATNLRRWRYFRLRLHDTDSALHLLKTSTISMAISSTLWGAAICLIIPVDRFPLPLTFFCAILANTAAATFYFGPHYPTFVAAALPMAVIGLSAIAVQGTLYHSAFFGLMSFFPAFMVFAWRFNRLVLTTHQLRFANLDLVTQLTTQKERAENATLAKSRFLAAASHDLRQPMHALNLYLGTLSAHALPEQARRALVNARRCAETMDDMFAPCSISRGWTQVSRRLRCRSFRWRICWTEYAWSSRRRPRPRACGCACAAAPPSSAVTPPCSTAFCAIWSAMRCDIPGKAAC